MERKNVDICAKYSSYTLTTIGVAKNQAGQTESGFHAGTYTQYSNEKLSAGETVTLTATVNDGYNFVGWFIDGVCAGTNFEYTHTMGKENITIEAVYSYYTLNTWASKGDMYIVGDYQNKFSEPSICMTKVYNYEKISVGSSITLTAKDVEGKAFEGWRTEDAFLSYDKEFTFNMPAGNMDIFAVYKSN